MKNPILAAIVLAAHERIASGCGPNYPDERGRGVPHPGESYAETRASMDRSWRESEAQEVRVRAAADAAYDNLKNDGRK